MINFSRLYGHWIKWYAAAVLVIATISSSLALSAVPVLILIWYIYAWRWRVSDSVKVLTEYFVFFSIALLMSPTVGSFYALVMAVPLLLLLAESLKEKSAQATFKAAKAGRRPTDALKAGVGIPSATLLVALITGSQPLLLASILALAAFIILSVVCLTGMTAKPVAAAPLNRRVLAGSALEVELTLIGKTKWGGRLYLESYNDWVIISPQAVELCNMEFIINARVTPTLSGVINIKLKGQATDPWGLFQSAFDLEALELYVIPRARYAAWLANKYLSQGKTGTLPLINNISAVKPQLGLRKGVEYYGNQVYQPGDSLKAIDWKHSLMYNELIVKEYIENQGRPAIVLINLAISNPDEADKLAFNIITTAISLAQDTIPAALAVYNQDEVKLTTSLLYGRQLVVQALQIAQDMVTIENPVRYLNPPNIQRLRANISRLRGSTSESAQALAKLLGMEYKNMENISRGSTATKALQETFLKAGSQSDVISISANNHDVEALEFIRQTLNKTGSAFISV